MEKENKFIAAEKKKRMSPIQVAMTPISQVEPEKMEEKKEEKEPVLRETSSAPVKSEANGEMVAVKLPVPTENSLFQGSTRVCPPNLNPIRKQNTKESKTQIAYYVDTEIYQQLKMFAAMYDVKKQDIVNEALRSYLERNM